MPQPHDVLVVQASASDDEGVRNRLFEDSQRVVSGHLEGRFHALVKPLAVVLDHAGFAVHNASAAADRGSGNQADGLVAKADSENGGAGQGAVSIESGFQHFQTYSGLVGRAGSGAEDDSLGGQGLNLLDCDRIVSVNDHVGSQLAQVLNKVESEAVVVVNDEDHGGGPNRKIPTKPKAKADYEQRLGL